MPRLTEPAPTAARRYVAFLRGVNVGRAKRVAMADLQALVVGLGAHNVRTVLNSGNVIFDVAADHTIDAADIETAFANRFGFTARATLLAIAELALILERNPYRDAAFDPSRLLVTFVHPTAQLRLLDPLVERRWAPEALCVDGRAAYLWCPDGVLAGRVFAAVDRALGDAGTARNWATLTKLHALAQT